MSMIQLKDICQAVTKIPSINGAIDILRTGSWIIRSGLGAVAILTASGIVYRFVWTEEDVQTVESKIEVISVHKEVIRPVGLRQLLKSEESPDSWNTAIFFPCYFPEEEPDGSFAQLLSYITSAEVSLKICVMTLTYRRIMREICDRHAAGVRVQIFTSFNCSRDPKSGVAGKFFRSKGIPVRNMKQTAYSTVMHHKYAVVDDMAILTGSMNWTNLVRKAFHIGEVLLSGGGSTFFDMWVASKYIFLLCTFIPVQSVTQQRENIMITTDTRIVSKFVSHFDTMWKENAEEEKNETAIMG